MLLAQNSWETPLVSLYKILDHGNSSYSHNQHGVVVAAIEAVKIDFNILMQGAHYGELNVERRRRNR